LVDCVPGIVEVIYFDIDHRQGLKLGTAIRTTLNANRVIGELTPGFSLERGRVRSIVLTATARFSTGKVPAAWLKKSQVVV
jgi:hypothetical protein